MITLSAIVGLSTLLLIHSSRSLRNSEIAIPIFLDRCRVALNCEMGNPTKSTAELCP